MTEPIPIQPQPEAGWEAAERARQEQAICWWHGGPCSTVRVREPKGQPICWDGWVSLLHATGTCSGECNYDHEPDESEPDRAMRKMLGPCRQDR